MKNYKKVTQGPSCWEKISFEINEVKEKMITWRVLSVDLDEPRRTVYHKAGKFARSPSAGQNPNRESSARIVEGSSQDVRRVVFIEESGIFTFAFSCDELGSEQITYLAYVENSSYAKGLLEPVLRAYAEYVSLLSISWTLHIWADASAGDSSYIFRNKPPSPPQSQAVASNGLRDLYEKYL